MSVYFSGDQLERIATFCEVVGISIPESPTLANLFLQVLDQHENRCNAFASTVSELENLNADLQRQIETANSVDASQDIFLQEQLNEEKAKYARLANIHTELRDRAKGAKELHTRYEALLEENKKLKAEIVSFSRMVQQEQQEKEQAPSKKVGWFNKMYNR